MGRSSTAQPIDASSSTATNGNGGRMRIRTVALLAAMAVLGAGSVVTGRATAEEVVLPRLLDVSVDRDAVWVAGTSTARITVRFRLLGTHNAPTMVEFERSGTPVPAGEWQFDLSLTPLRVSGDDTDAVYQASARVSARLAGVHTLSMICDCADDGAEPQYQFEAPALPRARFTVTGTRAVHLSVPRTVVPVTAASIPLVLRATDDRGLPFAGLSGEARAFDDGYWYTGSGDIRGAHTGPDGRLRIEAPLSAWGGAAWLPYPGPGREGDPTWAAYAAVRLDVVFATSTSARVTGPAARAGRRRAVQGTVAMARVEDLGTKGGRVELQRLVEGTWQAEDGGRVGDRGAFTLHARPPTPGRWSYRVVHRAGRYVLPSTSRPFVVVAR